MLLPPFKLEQFFAKYEFASPHLLCCSDCESFSMRELLELEEGASENLANLRLGYTQSLGSPSLRTAIASLYEVTQPDQILVHTGAEEAIFNFANAVLQRGDHVIVHWPCYQSFFEVAQSIGCEVTRWVTREAERWELDIDLLRTNLRKNTRAIFINCPHNPTGYHMAQQKFCEINAISKEHGVMVFSDEVYRLSEHNENDRLPACCDISEMGVSLGVMSKTFGLAGLRIGWVATQNKNVYDKMTSFKHYTTICNSGPSEFLAALALRNKEKVIARNRAIILKNLQILNWFFGRHREYFNWQPPKAGPIAFPSLANGMTADQFCHELLTKTGVLLMPGSVYNAFGNNFRIGFGRKNLPECLERMEKLL